MRITAINSFENVARHLNKLRGMVANYSVSSTLKNNVCSSTRHMHASVFKNVANGCAPSASSPASSSSDQLDQLNNELCILVDENDNITGQDSKRGCHASHRGGITKLHRAFSVFLFNSSNELLIQQRSVGKVTFPSYYTNSCCSHPRYNPDEMDGVVGAKVAVRRRMHFELGIPEHSIQLDNIHYLTRVHYWANSQNPLWAEHEMDYIFVCRQDVQLAVNRDEVLSSKYMGRDELKEFLGTADQHNLLITPWFQFIADSLLYQWWDSVDTGLHDIGRFQDPNTIHRAGHR